MWPEHDVQIMSVELKNGVLYVVCRKPSSVMLASNPPQSAPDEVWKDVYIAERGAIVHKERISGKHKPSTTVPEQFIFPGEDKPV